MNFIHQKSRKKPNSKRKTAGAIKHWLKNRDKKKHFDGIAAK